MGMILFFCGVALLAATIVTAIVFRMRPLRYAPQGMEESAGDSAPAAVSSEKVGATVLMDASAGMTVPMGEEAGRTVPMEHWADRTVPMSQGATVPMEADAFADAERKE